MRTTTVTLTIEVTNGGCYTWEEDFDPHEFLRHDFRKYIKQEPLVQLAGIGHEGCCTLLVGNVTSVKVKPSKSPGFIYFARAGSVFKIGRSTNPEKRIASLATGCPEPVRLYRKVQVQDMAAAEAFFHRHLKTKRSHGEWFKVSQCEIDSAISSWELPL